MKVSAIIPAYNEEKNIGRVISVLVQIEEIVEILVINDGSTDKTSEIARSYGVKVIDFPENRGKGLAMWVGVMHTNSPVVIFLDADLIGLTKQQVRDMISPIINGYADMTLGIFCQGRPMTDLAQRIAPYLTGQRAMKGGYWIILIKGIGRLDLELK